MCPFLDAPTGISQETLDILDSAFLATWQALHVSPPAAAPAELPQSGPFHTASDLACDLMSSAAHFPERIHSQGVAPGSERPKLVINDVVG